MRNQKIKEIINYLTKITCRGYSNHDVFEDWLDLMIYALMRNDEKYLKVVGRYKNEGEIGRREIDHFACAFGALMQGMATENEELLGLIYQEWNIQNKYVGQYFTPPQIAKLMAQITNPKGRILDPTCGSGIMLVESAKAMSYKDCSEAVFVGQDLDPTCVKMCALNMTFFNLNGYVVQGNTLAVEVNWGYRTIRSVYGGAIRDLTDDEIQMLKPSIREAMKEPEQMTLI
ncbi:MAG: hypothetical protein C4519_24280 [Desulfobacteraceae bacterium]|nr:MAG: hypothetical protein C4519_24280 [Desulfobacteraceae bacterium]